MSLLWDKKWWFFCHVLETMNDQQQRYYNCLILRSEKVLDTIGVLLDWDHRGPLELAHNNLNICLKVKWKFHVYFVMQIIMGKALFTTNCFRIQLLVATSAKRSLNSRLLILPQKQRFLGNPNLPIDCILWLQA